MAAWFVALPDGAAAGGGAAAAAAAAAFRARLDTLADDVQLMQSATRLAKNRPLFNATIVARNYTPPYADGATAARRGPRPPGAGGEGRGGARVGRLGGLGDDPSWATGA